MTDSGKEPYDHHRGKLPLMRTGSRWRLVVFLGSSYACFVAVNAFWLYISTGQWLDFTPHSYYHAVTAPLAEMFVYPVSLLEHNWMIVVTGLLLAVVIFVPIIVAVLYRMIFALLFVLMVALLGHAPVLAAALALGCVLASRTWLRSEMPFLAFLLGLLPPALYLLVFSFVGLEAATLPFHHLLLRAPLLVALVSAVLAAAAVLALARLMQYRPGVVCPVLAILVAVPVAIFYFQVGDDELQYDLIANDLNNTESLIDPMSLQDYQAANGLTKLKGPQLEQRISLQLEDRKADLVRRCGDFVSGYPHSRRAAAILYVQAQCGSLQLDRAALQAGTVRYIAAWAPASSDEAWRRLAQACPKSPQAALAGWQMAKTIACQGNFPAAKEQAARMCDQLRKALEQEREQQLAELGQSEQPLPGAEVYENALDAAQRLAFLLKRNRLAGESDAKALRAIIGCNEGKGASGLEELARSYGKGPLSDNIQLAIAKACGDVQQRATMLQAVAASGDDAAVEANYELGLLAMQLGGATAPTTRSVSRPAMAPAVQYLTAVEQAGDSPWQQDAKDKLAQLQGTSKP